MHPALHPNLIPSLTRPPTSKRHRNCAVLSPQPRVLVRRPHSKNLRIRHVRFASEDHDFRGCSQCPAGKRASPPSADERVEPRSLLLHGYRHRRRVPGAACVTGPELKPSKGAENCTRRGQSVERNLRGAIFLTGYKRGFSCCRRAACNSRDAIAMPMMQLQKLGKANETGDGTGEPQRKAETRPEGPGARRA